MYVENGGGQPLLLWWNCWLMTMVLDPGCDIGGSGIGALSGFGVGGIGGICVDEIGVT